MQAVYGGLAEEGPTNGIISRGEVSGSHAAVPTQPVAGGDFEHYCEGVPVVRLGAARAAGGVCGGAGGAGVVVAL